MRTVKPNNEGGQKEATVGACLGEEPQSLGFRWKQMTRYG